MSEDDAQRDPGEDIPAGVEGGSLASPRLVTPALLRSWPLPEPDGTKYSRGLALVVGGSCSTPGGVMLAGTSALRMGAGRLHIGTAQAVAMQVAVALPECGTTGLPQDDAGAVTGEQAGALLEKELSRADAVLLGPGLSDAEGAARLLEEVIGVLPEDTPVVLDAFGATTLPDVPAQVVERLGGRLLLTPNSGELARLVGRETLGEGDGGDEGAEEVVEAALAVARRFGAVVASNSWIVTSDATWQVTTGDTGLGTSGSGDVVAGATLGLLSRGAGLVQALVWAKYVHAAAGDVLAARLGRVGYLASEIPPQLPLVLGSLRGD